MITNLEAQTYDTKDYVFYEYRQNRASTTLIYQSTSSISTRYAVELKEAEEEVHISLTVKDWSKEVSRLTIGTSRFGRLYEKPNVLANELAYRVMRDVENKPEYRLKFVTGTKKWVLGSGISPFMQAYQSRREKDDYFKTQATNLVAAFKDATMDSKPSDSYIRYGIKLLNEDDASLIEALKEHGVIKSEEDLKHATFFGERVGNKRDEILKIIQNLSDLGFEASILDLSAPLELRIQQERYIKELEEQMMRNVSIEKPVPPRDKKTIWNRFKKNWIKKKPMP
jgi:hypothetical protein